MKVEPCSHEFHVGCLLDWLQVKDSCPCCRQQVVLYRCKIIRIIGTSIPTDEIATKQHKKCRRFLKSLFGKKEKRKGEVEDYKDLEEAITTLRHARAWLYNEYFSE